MVQSDKIWGQRLQEFNKSDAPNWVHFSVTKWLLLTLKNPINKKTLLFVLT